MMKLGTVIYYLKKVQKYINQVSYANTSIFHQRSATSVVLKNTDTDYDLTHNL